MALWEMICLIFSEAVVSLAEVRVLEIGRGHLGQAFPIQNNLTSAFNLILYFVSASELPRTSSINFWQRNKAERKQTIILRAMKLIFRIVGWLLIILPAAVSSFSICLYFEQNNHSFYPIYKLLMCA